MDKMDIDDILSVVNNIGNNGYASDNIENLLGELHHRIPNVNNKSNILGDQNSPNSHQSSSNSHRVLADQSSPNSHRVLGSTEQKHLINLPADPTWSASSGSDNGNNNDLVLDNRIGEQKEIDTNQKIAEMKHMIQNITKGHNNKKIIASEDSNNHLGGQSNVPSNVQSNVHPQGELKTGKKKVRINENGLKKTTTNDNLNAEIANNIASDSIDPLKAHLITFMGYSIPTTTLYFIIIMICIAVLFYFLTSEKNKDKDKDKEKEKDNSD